MLFLQEALQVSLFTQLNCFLLYHGAWKWWCRSSVHFLFQPGNPYFELSIRRGISNGCKSGVSMRQTSRLLRVCLPPMWTAATSRPVRFFMAIYLSIAKSCEHWILTSFSNFYHILIYFIQLDGCFAMLCWPTTHNISCSMGSPPPLYFRHHPRVFQTSFIFPRPNIQNAAWMDYDTTCILAREIRLNEIRALCFSAEIREFHQVTGGGQHRTVQILKPWKTHTCGLDFTCESLISC